jgi:hypothetical protein
VQEQCRERRADQLHDDVSRHDAMGSRHVFAYEAQAKYVANMKSLAYAANVPFIDIWGLFGWARKRSAVFDSLHPNHIGCELIAGYAKTAVLNPSAHSLSRCNLKHMPCAGNLSQHFSRAPAQDDR